MPHESASPFASLRLNVQRGPQGNPGRRKRARLQARKKSLEWDHICPTPSGRMRSKKETRKGSYDEQHSASRPPATGNLLCERLHVSPGHPASETPDPSTVVVQPDALRGGPGDGFAAGASTPTGANLPGLAADQPNLIESASLGHQPNRGRPTIYTLLMELSTPRFFQDDF